MVSRQLFTKNYKQMYSFQFGGKTYFTHSIVTLTDSGKQMLGSRKKTVILTEHFIMNEKDCWKYEIGWASNTNRPLTVSTDIPPDKLLEEVSIPASQNYWERQILGENAPSHKTGRKISRKDWEIPGLMSKWCIFITVCLGACIFEGWAMKLIVWNIAGWIFGSYHHAYKNAYTIYVHDEDSEIEKAKCDIRYR